MPNRRSQSLPRDQNVLPEVGLLVTATSPLVMLAIVSIPNSCESCDGPYRDLALLRRRAAVRSPRASAGGRFLPDRCRAGKLRIGPGAAKSAARWPGWPAAGAGKLSAAVDAQG